MTYVWDSNTTIAASTATINLDWSWAHGTINTIYAISGAGTYTVQATDAGSNISGCAVNATTTKGSSSCSTYAMTQHDALAISVTSPSGATAGGSVTILACVGAQ
jgi:hypothetical protein